MDEVLETLLYFVSQPSQDMQMFTLQALGFIVIRHYDMMLSERVKVLYHGFLQQPDVGKQLKAQVLINLETYLVEEERRMILQDEECELIHCLECFADVLSLSVFNFLLHPSLFVLSYQLSDPISASPQGRSEPRRRT